MIHRLDRWKGGTSLVLVIMSWVLAFTHPGRAAQPNILIILLDDAGFADFGFQAGGIDGDFSALTPHLDGLAAGGVRCRNAYVTAPTCCPSRAGLVIGRYQQKIGMENNVGSFQNVGLAPFQRTIADYLRALGYKTYAVGKWHLGNNLAIYHPNQRGFDRFVGFLSGARTYYQYLDEDDNRLQDNGTYLTEAPDQYTTDLWGSEAARLIETHVTENPTDPFFMYLSFNAVHHPLEPAPRHADDPRILSIEPAQRRALASMTIATDDAVGVVLAKLAEHNLRDDTLIFLLNDNGGPEDNENLDAPNWSDNGPLKAGKRSLYEGGIRVPFVVNWKNAIRPPAGGGVIDDLVSSLDLVPTCVAAAGGSVVPDGTMDGVNLLPRLLKETTKPIDRCLFWRFAGSSAGLSAVRQGPWKLYRKGAQAAELYNLDEDIGEETDLATTHPDKVAELLGRHAEWERGLVEPLWGPGAIASPDASLSVRPSELGYRLVNTDSGIASAVFERRSPLSRSEDWTLTWTMQLGDSVNKNGYILLTDEGGAGNAIRIGVNVDDPMVSIWETQVQDGANVNIPGLAPDDELVFFLDYDSSASSLTLRIQGQTVTRELTGIYGDFNHTGFSVRDLATTDFSPINLHTQPLAPPRSPSWTRVKSSRDYVPGTVDLQGNFMGGTEALSLVAHEGKLFAGIGYWNDERFIGELTDPYPGAQVLVKEAAGAPWKQDIAFGERYLRTESLQSFTITTDKDGNILDPPVNLLVAGTSPPVQNNVPLYNEVSVWVRDDATGTWKETSPGTVAFGFPVARYLFDHIDQVTGQHHLFCAYGSDAHIVRGGYDPATGLIVWDEDAELTGSRRLLSAGECNGWLYACIGSDGDYHNNDGGVFWREDGPDPKWHFIHEFPLHPDTPHQDVRGFTGVPHPKGFDYEVGLVVEQLWSRVSYLDPIGGDPRNGHTIVEELDIQQFLADQWNGGLPLDYEPTVAAYNDMPTLTDPTTGETVHFLGIWVKDHPAEAGSEEDLNTWYLIRYRDGTYDWGQIIDPAFPHPYPDYDPYPGLRACRCMRPSPFREEAGRVFYTGGFDAATPDSDHHNTAWIYRSELPREYLQVQPRLSRFSIGIETVHGWDYQLEERMQSLFVAPGPRLPGSNAVRGVEVDRAPSGRQIFRWRISR